MTLRLYDTRRGGVHPFSPPPDRPVGLYVCGVTPYDTGHLGHAFTYLSFDVLHRYLEYLGHEVVYVQNLTDVDDDMLRRAREMGEDYLALGNRNVATFLTEMAALNWLPPDRFPRATEHIDAAIDLTARLLERGYAYSAEGHVYFAVERFERYGDLSRVPRDQMLEVANERGNVPDMPGKREPLDFVLWQRSAPDEPRWESPWGPGRPGWHIECSAMSMAYLGPSFAIHGGGTDLAFPHHESEIAQSEAATGIRPFAEFWMHTGMLHHNGDKMSKSVGNLVLVRDLLNSHPDDAIRHYLLGHHYRSEPEFEAARLDASAAAAARLRAACRRAERIEPAGTTGADPQALDESVRRARQAFLDAMDDDLDTRRALAALDDLAAICEASPDRRPGLAAQAGWMLRELGARVMGLRLATMPPVPGRPLAEAATTSETASA